MDYGTKRAITVGGLPLSGKGKNASLVSDALKGSHWNIGKIIRADAQAYAQLHGIPPEDALSAHQQWRLKNPNYDIAIDRRQLDYVKAPGVHIFDSRLGGPLFYQLEQQGDNSISSLRFKLDVSDQEAARRLLLDTSRKERPVSIEHAVEMNTSRTATDHKLYLERYQISNFLDDKYYHQIIHTDQMSINDVTDAMLTLIKKWHASK